tara:strand:- start:346 stop:501 length:156 start_codon:yes stop_codon:yes gene_type:complete
MKIEEKEKLIEAINTLSDYCGMGFHEILDLFEGEVFDEEEANELIDLWEVT